MSDLSTPNFFNRVIGLLYSSGLMVVSSNFKNNWDYFFLATTKLGVHCVYSTVFQRVSETLRIIFIFDGRDPSGATMRSSQIALYCNKLSETCNFGLGSVFPRNAASKSDKTLVCYFKRNQKESLKRRKISIQFLCFGNPGGENPFYFLEIFLVTIENYVQKSIVERA